MAEGDRQPDSQQTDGVLSRSTAADRIANQVQAVVEFAEHVAALHRQGRLHLRISMEALSWSNDGQLHLSPPGEEGLFGGPFCDPESGPAALQMSRVVIVPTNIQKAQKVLRQAGLSLEPESIDLHQLAALLCRVLTQESLSAYLRCPGTKNKIPARFQEVIELAVSQSSDTSPRVAEFARLLRQAAASEVQPQADSVKEDTAPSLHASEERSDTAIGEQCNNTPPVSLPFQWLGHFEIRERIGQGGMGDVYKAYERSLDRTVAIKVLPLEFSSSEDFVRRFNAEATAIARLVHPNVIQIFSMGEDQGYHYFAMQFIEGISLAERLSVQKALDLEETLAIVKQLLLGLAAAHEFGLVHRDIKPGNILLEAKTGKAYLADFGLVKSLQSSEGFTATGMVMGTVDYIAPEQGRGRPVDARADLYSLGVVMYRMLSGRLPFEANSPTAMIFQHVYETPRPLNQVVPSLPTVYWRIVEKLLAKHPDERYPTAMALLDDLNAAQKGQPLSLPGSRTAQNRSGTAMIQVPQLPSGSQLPGDLKDLVEANLWRRLWNRAVDFFFEPSFDFYHYLQSTQHQVDGVVESFEQRCSDLDQFAQEADNTLGSLHDQLDQWVAASEFAERRRDQTLDPESAHDTQTDYDQCQANIGDLYRQIEQQSQERDEIHRQQQEVEAKLAQIRHQRDLLSARLKLTHAQLHPSGGPEERPSSSPPGVPWVTMHVAEILVAVLIAAAVYRVFFW